MSPRLLPPALLCLTAALLTTGCDRPVRNDAPPTSASLEAAPLQIRGTAIYVAPGGNDSAAGDEAAPLATLEAALKRWSELPESEEATIILRGGVYTESLSIPGRGSLLTITGAPDEEVIFEGAQAVSGWKPHPEVTGVFITEVAGRESLYGVPNFLDIWDDTARVRYGKMADVAAVAHWPGSVCMGEGDTVYLSPHEGDSPDALDLRANRRARGLSITGNDVTLKNLHFRNYVGGGEARAVTISKGDRITIEGCKFTNCTIGISTSADHVSVLDSTFREVGNGIRHAGKGKSLTVRRCLLESATGLFAFSDVSEHLRNGIRVYFYSDGAKVEECVTSGFWAGLYIKTASGEPEAQPYLIRNNTFLDGIRSGVNCPHPKTTITGNILGTPSTTEGAGKKADYYTQMGAKVEDNLFFGTDAPETAAPMLDPSAGDLNLKDSAHAHYGASTQRAVSWSPRMSRFLAPDAPASIEARLISPPVVAASLHGFVITADYSAPVTLTARFRQVGSEAWLSIPGHELTLYPATNMIAMTPHEPVRPDRYRWTFPMVGKLPAEPRHYEYELIARETSGRELPPLTGKITTQGAPKVLHIGAQADPATADGSAERPFRHLQEALNRALPGDTLRLGPGLYDEPALLTHGGTPTARLTIQGAGRDATILDGGKRASIMLSLTQAPHVSVRDLQVRWFGNHGIQVIDSPGFALGSTTIWNQGLEDKGHCGIGLLLRNSPQSTILGNLFLRLQSCAVAVNSPQLTFTQNTACGNLYSGLDLIDSARGSTVTHNSLTFTGNRALHIKESDPDAFASLVLDYNNYAATIRKQAPKRPENDFTVDPRYGILLSGQAKGIIALTMGKDVWRDFHTMSDWRAFSSKDTGSIFTDPAYESPRDADFRLRPGSPNLLGSGKFIGAFPSVSSPEGAGGAVGSR